MKPSTKRKIDETEEEATERRERDKTRKRVTRSGASEESKVQSNAEQLLR
jgi:hypothetical protein